MPVSVGDVRTRAAAVIGTALVLALSGCTTPEPAAPTPTAAFASEEEAFAAAEETYRAYVDALNRVDLSDPETFEDVYAWTTGEANAEARKTFTQMHADGWTVSGESEAVTVQPGEASDDLRTVALAVCLKVADVSLVDSSGRSVVSGDRPPVQSMLVTLEQTTSTATMLAINDFSGREGDPEC